MNLCVGTSAIGLLIASVACAADGDAAARYRDVLTLKPLSFWPADEGEGSRLRDLGEIGNDANLFNTPWNGNALDFTAAFQFVEIPERSAYMSTEFSLGAWVFVRRPRAGASHESRGTHVFGNWTRHWSTRPGPISLRLTGKNKLTVEIVSNKEKDALGSVAAGIQIEPETWQHLLYTYRGGEGTLFLGGKRVRSKKGVAYTPQKGEYIAGSDSRWWFLYPPRSEALDGSLRDIVLFDRALSETAAAVLVSAGQPSTRPHVLAEDELRLHGRFIQFGDLDELSQEDQRLAIRHMASSRQPRTGRSSLPALEDATSLPPSPGARGSQAPTCQAREWLLR